MSAGTAGKLYTPAMLSLATELAHFPLIGDWPHKASSRSRTCGSTVELGLRLADDGTVDAIGLKISACAIGQASAALLAKSISGKAAPEVLAARNAIEAWLASKDPLPDWPGLELIEAARDSKGRHGALLLSWNAAAEALSLAQASS
ncbi:MAG: iron-sulfur cluster assembly scaffold protein [Alphaproteobacteria bacterium]|nr:MAG: iron-sulfur cluster assembly scaffold protein [Alphaproteobacteria bacterium]